ncbi:hypothetical protein EP342_05170 [bacterium]|nr:MAG: hypothetical protein EP342_05170 [bacterium]
MRKILVLLFFLPICLLAQIPQTMNYQGKLEDNSGNPVADGNYSVIFTIYDAATSGNLLWTESRTITTEDGFFNLILGENTAINISTDKQLWLNVNVEGTDLTPRTKLAGNLSTLSTKSIENTATAGNSVVEAINSSTGGVNTLKLADGTISNSELQSLNNVSGNIQSQLDGKQATLPDTTGKTGKYLSVSSTGLSWEAVSGGGSSVTATTLSLASNIDINDTNYVDITGVTMAMEANSTYLIKGTLGAERTGGNSYINIKLDYSGTTNLNMMTINYFNLSNDYGEITSYKIVSDQTIKHLIDATIDTDSVGTFQLKVRKSFYSNDKSIITTNTKLVVIKIR